MYKIHSYLTRRHKFSQKQSCKTLILCLSLDWSVYQREKKGVFYKRFKSQEVKEIGGESFKHCISCHVAQFQNWLRVRLITHFRGNPFSTCYTATVTNNRKKNSHPLQQRWAAGSCHHGAHKHTGNHLLWPIRWQRAAACRSFWGLKSLSMKMTVSAAVRFRPTPPAKQRSVCVWATACFCHALLVDLTWKIAQLHTQKLLFFHVQEGLSVIVV